MNGLSVIIPAFNEAGSIRETVAGVLSALSRVEAPSEVIVVDDASGDGTAGRAREAGAQVVSHESNRGYGEAIKSGMAKAAHDLILIIDADGTYPCRQIPDLAAWCDTHDMVVGARTGGQVAIPFSRRPAKWALAKVANYLAGTRIPDLNSGMRIFRKDAARRFMFVLPSGFSFTSTITLAMLCNGYRVKYVPIDYFTRTGKSKIRPIADTANFFQLVVRTALYFKPLQVFMPLGLFLVAAAVAVLLVSSLFLDRVMDVTVIVIFMTAVQVFTIGLLADLIDKRLQG